MQFDNATLSTLATKAIIDSMTPEHREQLLARAVASLFEKEEKDRFNHSKPVRTKFEAAFDDALGNAMRNLCNELLRTEEFQVPLRALLAKAVEKAISGENAEKLVDIFANAIVVGMDKKAGY